MSESTTTLASFAPPEPNAKSGTKMENFEPIAGSVIVMAYESIGKIQDTSVEVRKISADKGGYTRGMLITVQQDQHRSGGSFVDADEIPELLGGLEALLAVTGNPTRFNSFQVRYKTKED